ncbi:MAG: hypothetical protein IJ521_09960 [Schwartzia sp.]|nr:hypothetical protein [Schwartzia sp. (in: firmicutes)]
MIVTDYLDTNKPAEFSEDELKALDELEKRPIVFDDDCPELTQEQIAEYWRTQKKHFASA